MTVAAEFTQTANVTAEQQRVADAVQLRMDELGFVQRTLAQEAGVDTGTVNNLMTGRHWPRVRQRSRIEAALKWPLGTLATIRAGGDPPQEQPPPDGSDPAEDTIRGIPHLLDEDVERFIRVYRTRRDEHTRRRIADLIEMQERLTDSELDAEQRATIEAQFQRQINALRSAGYEAVRTESVEPETEP